MQLKQPETPKSPYEMIRDVKLALDTFCTREDFRRVKKRNGNIARNHTFRDGTFVGIETSEKEKFLIIRNKPNDDFIFNIIDREDEISIFYSSINTEGETDKKNSLEEYRIDKNAQVPYIVLPVSELFEQEQVAETGTTTFLAIYPNEGLFIVDRDNLGNLTDVNMKTLNDRLNLESFEIDARLSGTDGVKVSFDLTMKSGKNFKGEKQINVTQNITTRLIELQELLVNLAQNE